MMMMIISLPNIDAHVMFSVSRGERSVVSAVNAPTTFVSCVCVCVCVDSGWYHAVVMHVLLSSAASVARQKFCLLCQTTPSDV